MEYFIGDMSVVGPRPLTKETRDYIPAEILDEIQDVQPGLTGIGSMRTASLRPVPVGDLAEGLKLLRPCPMGR